MYLRNFAECLKWSEESHDCPEFVSQFFQRMKEDSQFIFDVKDVLTMLDSILEDSIENNDSEEYRKKCVETIWFAKQIIKDWSGIHD